jgi:hypothetical protein
MPFSIRFAFGQGTRYSMPDAAEGVSLRPPFARALACGDATYPRTYSLARAEPVNKFETLAEAQLL